WVGRFASGVRGSLVVEDKHVTITGATGRFANGTLDLKSADLDFRHPISVQRYELEADRLSVRDLPPSWRRPKLLAGKLSGHANLTVRVINGHAIPAGSGEGRVDDASWALIPLRRHYGLRFQADENGLRFEPAAGGTNEEV